MAQSGDPTATILGCEEAYKVLVKIMFEANTTQDRFKLEIVFADERDVGTRFWSFMICMFQNNWGLGIGDVLGIGWGLGMFWGL
eukprot:Pgem_evm1s19560